MMMYVVLSTVVVRRSSLKAWLQRVLSECRKTKLSCLSDSFFGFAEVHKFGSIFRRIFEHLFAKGKGLQILRTFRFNFTNAVIKQIHTPKKPGG